jgi:hypothetical protein
MKMLPNPLVGRNDIYKQLIYQGQLSQLLTPINNLFGAQLNEAQGQLAGNQQQLQNTKDRLNFSRNQLAGANNINNNLTNLNIKLIQDKKNLRLENRANRKNLREAGVINTTANRKLYEAGEINTSMNQVNLNLNNTNKMLEQNIQSNSLFSRQALYNVTNQYIIESAPKPKNYKEPVMLNTFDYSEGKIAFATTLEESSQLLENSFGLQVVEPNNETNRKTINIKGKRLGELIDKQTQQYLQQYPNEANKYGSMGKRRYFFEEGNNMYRISAPSLLRKPVVFEKNTLFGTVLKEK